MKRSSRNLLGLAAAATLGYGIAFAGAKGAVLAAFLTLGIAAELGLWLALVRRFRGADG